MKIEDKLAHLVTAATPFVEAAKAGDPEAAKEAVTWPQWLALCDALDEILPSEIDRVDEDDDNNADDWDDRDYTHVNIRARTVGEFDLAVSVWVLDPDDENEEIDAIMDFEGDDAVREAYDWAKAKGYEVGTVPEWFDPNEK